MSTYTSATNKRVHIKIMEYGNPKVVYSCECNSIKDAYRLLNAFDARYLATVGNKLTPRNITYDALQKRLKRTLDGYFYDVTIDGECYVADVVVLKGGC